MTPAPEGLLLIHKPAGPTSHDIVAWVRRATGQRRAGHTGTLDPPASGLLVLALGRATRLIRFLPDAPKLYEGTLALGLTTETDDLTGNVLSRADEPLPTFEAIQEAIATLVGKQLQIPPAVSARKVDGERLYRKARRGEFVQAPASDIEVFGFEVQPSAMEGRIPFRASVSKGTYIRSLARDLGERLGCGGALAELRRTAIGPFELGNAVDPPERGARQWDPGTTIPLDQAPLTLPTETIQAAEMELFGHGGGIERPGNPDGWVRVADPEDRILGVGQVVAGRLTPRVVLFGPTG